MKKVIFAGLIFLATTSNCFAANATNNLTVTATITATCTVTAATLAFGTYADVLLDGTTNIAVTCTNGTPYSISLGAGSHTGATVTTRAMDSGGNFLNYSLFREAGRTTNWGNTPSIDTVAGTGTGGSVDHPVYGRILAAQNKQAGSYSDTVIITATY